MPTIRLTQLTVDRLKPTDRGRVIYWDRHLPGFGLRITGKGGKSWIAAYRVNRRLVMETIGKLAVIPKLDDARELARASMCKAHAGVNPVAERKRKQEEAAKTTSFAVIFERFIERYAKQKQSAETLAETKRQFDKDVLPRWGRREISAITEADIRRLRDEIHDRAPIQANRLLGKLGTLFGWAAREKYIAVDPTVGVDPIAKEVSRDRWLTDPEIVKFWSGCDQVGWPYGPLFKLLLLTAQRRDEVAGMEWSEIDFAQHAWVLPASKSKNGKGHEIHLSALAVEIIESVPRISESRWVFTQNGATPLRGWSSAKQKLDDRLGEMEPWRLHDLRRTAASNMARLGVRAEVADKVLNHSGGSVVKGVAAIYNRHAYLDERRAALETWSRHVESLVNPDAQANVIPLRGLSAGQ